MLWADAFPRFFLTLTYNQQRALHDYYRFTEDLTDDLLLNHQAKIKDERPELASQAGKAFGGWNAPTWS